ncbi:hypothetical protein M422DRAFT_259549 [Sphaerobolus stellatus SS14]|uniref:Uncharacterized protein n=1 Tax=Sphaerobolus stellatus (strain SS14) TaxID=990650 RepID=A0A0C9USX3_SPHS4|nr:hypothetical protein M422DRAFT_259549 [Sphaerobolus stellatus SS14]
MPTLGALPREPAVPVNPQLVHSAAATASIPLLRSQAITLGHDRYAARGATVLVARDRRLKRGQPRESAVPGIETTYAALVLGLSSVNNAESDPIYIWDSSHCNMESKWSVRNITPGAIAASAVLARFAASTDAAFQPVGKTINIEYQHDFEYYLKYFHKGLRNKAPSVLDIFKQWDTVFYQDLSEFPKQVSKAGSY